ncbi:MAG: Gfo/Idh/MocA family oxidoreductase [Gemmatimonadales bacterium]|nr:MAG: Gfo/Idh/MocA family oxidoreductase [Gemmatimonadales bacterium]
MDRRDFVKAGAAAALGGVTLSDALPLRASTPSSDALRIGVIGCGGRGTGAAVQALSTNQDVKLVAMADAFPDRVESSFRNLMDTAEDSWSGGVDLTPRIDVPEERRFAGFDAYQKVLPLVDVVILATPPGFRPMHFRAAVEAGKHVFMEKPVATDAPGVRSVLETAAMAEERKLNVVVGLQRRYQTVYREWVDRIRAGMIGEVILGRVYWNDGGVWVRERQAEQTEMEYQMRNWYYFTWLCGDHIVEQHIHNLDVANWVLGDSHPVRAQGQGGRLVRTGPDHGQIFDHHMVEFEYEGGGRLLSQCRHMPNTARRVSEAFHGTNGTAPRPGEIVSASGHVLFRHDTEGDPNPYQVEHDELFAAIAAGEFRYADGERGARASMTAILGRMATYSGQVVEWEEALASQLSLMPSRYAWDAPPPVLPDGNGRYPVPVPGVSQVF